MKLRPRPRKASESPVRKIKLRKTLKKPKEKAGAHLNRRPVKREGLEGKHNGQVSTSSVSNMETGPGSGVAHFLEEVLEHIFGFLTFADVKSARLVNKHWRQVATTLLQRSSKQIKLDRSVSECIAKLRDGEFPVNRLEVILFADHYDPEIAKIDLASFPRICAWVKELTLSVDINKQSPLWLPEDIVTFPTDCVYKDLTHFNLQLIQQMNLFFSQESWNRFTNFVRTILEQSPNLREVNVGYKSYANLGICPVIENLFPFTNSVGTSKLSSINFEYVPLGKIDLAKWSTLNLRLRKLGLNVSCFNNTNDLLLLLAKFLETQTGTLQQLTLRMSHWDSKAAAGTFTFPRLEKLEQLRVISDGIPVTFAGIDYVRLFPCLKTLDLKEDRVKWRDFIGNDLLKPTDTVKELIFPWILRLSDDVNVTKNTAVTAAKLFTGLKKLEIYADYDLIEAVYDNMPNLEVLTLYNFSVETHDDNITGLDLDVCRRFRGVMTETWTEKLQNAEGRSMARLQNLKTLKLSDCGYNGRLYISRLSFHVFKKMSSLKCLDLFNGRAKTAELCSADEDQKQFLGDLRANFVVL